MLLPKNIPQTIVLLFLLIPLASPATAEIKLGLVLAHHDNDKKKGNFEAEILDATNTAFITSRRFKLAERAALDDVIAEKGLQDFIGALSGNTAGAQMEKLVGIDMIGLVSFGTDPGVAGSETVWISVRLVSVLTGDILNTIDSRRAGLTPPTTAYLAGTNLAQNIREFFPPEGYIVQVNGDEAIVDLGSDVGLKKNDILEIIQEGEIIFHPVTGEALPGQEIVLGTLKVVQVSNQTATCKIRDAGAEPSARVRLKPKDQRAYKALGFIQKIKSLKGN